MSKSADSENLPDLSPITVSSADNDGEKRKKMIKYIIIAAVVAAVIIIAAVIAVKSAKSKSEDTDVYTSEDSGEMTNENEAPDEEDAAEDESDESIYTLSANLEIDYSAMSDEYTEDLLDHMDSTTVKTTEKAATAAASAGTTAASQTQAQTSSSQAQSTTKEAVTVKTTEATTSAPSVIDDISSFFSGTYYLDGSMLVGSDETPIEMAMNGSNVEVFTEMEGMDIAMLQLDGKIYLLNPDTKKYMELSSTLMKTMGVSEEDFSFSFTNLNFDGSNPSSVTQATVDGASATCYTYIGSNASVDFFAVNDEIVQIEIESTESGTTTVLKIDEFSASVPSGMLTLSGYSKTNMISFFSALM
ncbi:MAG: hypothetical protein LUH40_04670 [Clostridiales bacterium]|nr:hypothetical protein [Clostridiales bacterium]